MTDQNKTTAASEAWDDTTKEHTKMGDAIGSYDERHGPKTTQAWPTRGPNFNQWNGDAAAMARLIQDNPNLWLCDSKLKYLNLYIDTRSGHFVLTDRDGGKVSPDRVVAAAEKWKQRLERAPA